MGNKEKETIHFEGENDMIDMEFTFNKDEAEEFPMSLAIVETDKIGDMAEQLKHLNKLMFAISFMVVGNMFLVLSLLMQ